MKTYTIRKMRKGITSDHTGTVEELTKYFSYTLEIGNSWNRKINRHPKTIKSLLTNLQNSYAEKEASCYERTSVELV